MCEANSATACWVQITEVVPPMSRNGPDWSLRTPILKTGLLCARARGIVLTAAAVPRRARRDRSMIITLKKKRNVRARRCPSLRQSTHPTFPRCLADPYTEHERNHGVPICASKNVRNLHDRAVHALAPSPLSASTRADVPPAPIRKHLFSPQLTGSSAMARLIIGLRRGVTP